MFKQIYREFYLLSRGEQRALILLSLILILSLIFRITVQLLPDREPEGLAEFEQEARLLMAALAEADSLKSTDRNSAGENERSSPGHSKVPAYQTRTKAAVSPVDINRADSAQLLPLRGIGPVFAGRIIKYRNLLGGFTSPDQLGEVYGVSDVTLDMIKEGLVIDTSCIRKLKLNSATFSELLRHPYLEFEDVKSLMQYRDFKGNISSANDLRTNQILPDTILRMMHGYFDYSRSTEAVDLSK